MEREISILEKEEFESKKSNTHKENAR